MYKTIYPSLKPLYRQMGRVSAKRRLDFYNALADVYFSGWGAAYLDTARQQFAEHLQPMWRRARAFWMSVAGPGNWLLP